MLYWAKNLVGNIFNRLDTMEEEESLMVRLVLLFLAEQIACEKK